MSNPHEIKTVKCAHCGKVRQEANHWFVAAVEGGRFRCRPMAPFVVAGAKEKIGAGRCLKQSERPVCGQECAQKHFERYLAGEAVSRRH
jgi:endogenous inhibitor of DNA gyrase (YacG/DUF329 family)